MKISVSSTNKELNTLTDSRFDGYKMGGRLNDLFLRFQIKGFMSIEIPELVKDVLDIMVNKKLRTITAIDRELEELGWGMNIMDNATYELITSLIEGNAS